jgi:hypothetical protein
MKALCLRCFVDVGNLDSVDLNSLVRTFLAPEPRHIQENKGLLEKSIFN